MKSNWQKIKLGEILTLQSGYAFSSKKFSQEDGMPLIRIRDIKNGLTTEVNYIGAYESKYLVNKGDLLIGMDGEFRCYEWKGEQALLNQRVCKLKDFKGIHPKFLLYGINKYLKEIEDVTTFTTVKHISAKKILDIQFPLPSEIVQKQIVSKLDQAFEAIDQAIANTDKNIENVNDLFKSYSDTLLEMADAEYSTCYIDDVSKSISAGGDKPKNNFSTAKTETNLIPVVANSVKSEGIIGYTNEATINEQAITVAARGSGTGHVSLRKYPFYPVVRLISIIPDTQKVCLEYLAILLKANDFKISGSAIPQLTVPMLKKMQIRLPNIEKQEKVSEHIIRVESLKLELEKLLIEKASHLNDLKMSILERAFKGELV